MTRWLFLIILSLHIVACSPAYASPLTIPQEDAEKVTRSLREAPMESHMCLALNLYHESRGESIESWVAIAFVTINRVIDDRFPDDICSVVWEPYQFSWTHDGISDIPDTSKYADKKAWEYIQEFSKGFLENFDYIEDPTGGALYYHADYVEPYWKDSFAYVGVIGRHLFYRNDTLYR